MANYIHTFTQGDGPLDSNWGGAGAALWATFGNVARKNNAADGMAVFQLPADSFNHEATVTVVAAGTGDGYPNVMARVATAADTLAAGTFYWFYTGDTSGDAGIGKTVAGAGTVLLDLSGTLVVPSAPFTMTLRVDGDVLTAFVNGVQVGQVTNGDITTGLFPGFSYGNGSAAARDIDTFSFADLVAPPPQVTFVAAGSFAGNITVATQAITAPACAAGDILICALINKSVTANAVTPPDGTWTAVIATEVNDCTTAADDHQYSLFWKRATGSGGSFTFTKAVDDNLLFGGVIVAYRGARTEGSPLDATVAVRTETAGAADNVTFPAYDPVSTNNRVIYVAYYGNDLTTFAAAMSADTNPDCTIDVDTESALGNDCSIAFTSGTNDGSSIAGRTWASAATTDAGNTGVVFALVAQIPPVGRLLAIRQAVQRAAVR